MLFVENSIKIYSKITIALYLTNLITFISINIYKTYNKNIYLTPSHGHLISYYRDNK